MKLSKKIILAAAAVLVSSSTMAQLTTFEADTTASASEVNGNFTYLLGLIEDLQADVAALEADAPTQSVSGRTYTLLNTRGFFEDQRTGATNDSIILMNAGAAEVDITFNANGSVTVGDIYEEEVDMYWDTATNQPGTSVSNISSGTDTNPPSPSWTQDGPLVTVTIFELELYASADGSMLAFRDFGQDFSESPEEDERFAWEFGVWVEIPVQ